MKPNTDVSTSAVTDVNWVFTTDGDGKVTTETLRTAAALETVKLLRAQGEMLTRIEQALRALDVTSLDETREAVRVMLHAEFGLVRMGGK